jgi:uncharacterized repeat protein (TIGR02543 family)
MTNSARLIAIAATLLLGLSFSGCRLMADTVDDEKVTIRLSATSEGYDLPAGSSRTVMPSTSPAIDSFVLFGAAGGGAQEVLGTFASLAGATLSLAEGSWDFTLSAVSSGAIMLEGKLNGMRLSSGSTTLAFVLEPIAGRVQVSLTWSGTGAPVAAVIASFGGVAVDPGLPIVDEGVGFVKTGVLAGDYPLNFRLLDADGGLLTAVSETVQVLDAKTSSQAIVLAASDFMSPPAAPSAFTAVSAGNTSDLAEGRIALSWADESRDETGFEIQLSDGTLVSDSIAAAATSYEDRAARGSARGYMIRAVNDFGASPWVDASPGYAVPYLARFDSQGGRGVETQEVAPGGLVAEPFPPTKSGLFFAGWYADAAYATPWSFSAPVNGNLVLYAKWSTNLVQGPYTYSVSTDGKATVLSYSGSETAVVVPATMGGYPVAYIAAACFKSNSAITSVSLPGTVERIEAYSFSSCRMLASVSIPSGVTSIGRKAFYGCSSLGSVSLLEGVAVIDENAFESCVNLVSVSIPSSATSIGIYAFFGCTKLSAIAIPRNVASIGYYSFLNCTSLRSIDVEASNAAYCSVDGVLFDGAKSTLLCYPAGKAGASYAVPDSVTSIADTGFYACASLVAVTVPATVSSMALEPFRACSSLSSVIVNATQPPTLGSSYAFYGNAGNRLIKVPKSTGGAVLAAYKAAPNWSAWAGAIVEQ